MVAFAEGEKNPIRRSGRLVDRSDLPLLQRLRLLIRGHICSRDLTGFITAAASTSSPGLISLQGIDELGSNSLATLPARELKDRADEATRKRYELRELSRDQSYEARLSNPNAQLALWALGESGGMMQPLQPPAGAVEYYRQRFRRRSGP